MNETSRKVTGCIDVLYKEKALKHTYPCKYQWISKGDVFFVSHDVFNMVYLQVGRNKVRKYYIHYHRISQERILLWR